MTSPSWNRRIWTFAAPVILSNISVPLLGAVDTAVVGRLPGPEPLGAVAVASLIFNVLYAGLFFLRMGTTGLTAQAFGRDGHGAARVWLFRAVLLALALGATLIALHAPVRQIAFAVVAPKGEVATLARAYYDIRIFGAPAALGNMALLGWFFGVQKTRAALITQLVMNSGNIALDILFVRGLGWGVRGVALATLISELGALALGLALAYRITRDDGASQPTWRLADLWDRRALARMFAVNRDIFIRSMCLQAAFTTFTSLSARMGNEILAANAVLMNFQMFMAFGLDGFANAAESFVGEAIGARDRATLRAAVRASTRWAAGLALVFTAVYAALGGQVIDALTSVTEVRTVAREYLIWVALLPIVSVWSFQLDGIFVGATATTAMRNSMALSLAIFVVSLTLLLPAWKNHGLWSSLTVFMAARGLTLGRYYPRLCDSVPTPETTMASDADGSA